MPQTFPKYQDTYLQALRVNFAKQQDWNVALSFRFKYKIPPLQPFNLTAI